MDFKQAVDLAKAGREEGYNYLYQQTYQKSYYVALKYMKQEDAALDVLQDAYIKAFKNLGQLQEADKFPAWFSRVVATKALDELRKTQAVLFSQMGNEDDEINVEDNFQDDRIDAQPEMAMDQAETSRLVQEMIDTLSDEQRLCIMMFYVEEMSVKDIAETLGVSENTVKSRLNYGRKNIKEKVLDLEKNGTKLYSIAPIPFFLWMLSKDSINVQAATMPSPAMMNNVSSQLQSQIGSQAGSGTATQMNQNGQVFGTATKTATTAAKSAGLSTGVKVLIGVVATAIVGSGVATGMIMRNSQQEETAQYQEQTIAQQPTTQTPTTQEATTQEPTTAKVTAVDMKNYVDIKPSSMGGNLETTLASAVAPNDEVKTNTDDFGGFSIAGGKITGGSSVNGDGYFVWVNGQVDNFTVYGAKVGMTEQDASSAMTAQGVTVQSDMFGTNYIIDARHYITLTVSNGTVTKIALHMHQT